MEKISKPNILPTYLAEHSILAPKNEYKPTGKKTIRSDDTIFNTLRYHFEKENSSIEVVTSRPLAPKDETIFSAICTLFLFKKIKEEYTEELNRNIIKLPINDIMEIVGLDPKDTKLRKMVISSLKTLADTRFYIKSKKEQTSNDSKKIRKHNINFSLLPFFDEIEDIENGKYGRGYKKTYAIQLDETIKNSLKQQFALRDMNIVRRYKSSSILKIYNFLSLKCGKGQPYYRKFKDFMTDIQFDYKSQENRKKVKKDLKKLANDGVIGYELKNGTIRVWLIKQHEEKKTLEPNTAQIINDVIRAFLGITYNSSWLQEIKNILNS
jgi:hypothetical protein